MKKVFFLFMAITSLLSSCGNNIETIKPENLKNNAPTGIFSTSPKSGTSAQPAENDHHHVIVKEILETQKYIYCLVQENQKQFWIASIKMPFELEKEYVYNGGLLKTNFKSVEHDRVFDTLYLVSEIVPANHSGAAHQNQTPENTNSASIPTTTNSTKGKKPEQAISIKEIINNPEKYANKEVVVYGKVSKVNANIMNRNWLHLQDGSADDFDFVLTSNSVIPVGHTLAFKGTIHTNVDFGAGYAYNIIMENAEAL